MEYAKYSAILASKLTKERYKHSLGVSHTAEQLAKRFGVSPEKAKIAGLLHDCAREFATQNFIEIAKNMKISINEIERNSPILLHAAIGSVLVESQYQIADDEIKRAIRLHTTGGKNMTKLDKIIYLADMIEPNRNFAEVGHLRMLSEKDLNEAVFAALNQSILHVIKCNQIIHPDTIIARNEMLLKESVLNET